MEDKLKEIGIQALIAAGLGGVLAYLLSFVLGPILALDTLFGPLIGGIIAIVVLVYVATKTELDTTSFWNVIVLLLAVAVVGTFVVGIIPAAAPYILTLADPFTSLLALGWTLIYVGAALAIYDKLV